MEVIETKAIKRKNKYNDFVLWLEKTVKEYSQIMLLQSWTISVGKTPKKNRDNIIFTISRDAQYIAANIEWFQLAFSMWKADKIDDLKQSIIHELIHIILTEFSDCAYKRSVDEKSINDAEEKATEHISKILYNLINLKGVLANSD